MRDRAMMVLEAYAEEVRIEKAAVAELGAEYAKAAGDDAKQRDLTIKIVERKGRLAAWEQAFRALDQALEE